jgi:hypothetical protein
LKQLGREEHPSSKVEYTLYPVNKTEAKECGWNKDSILFASQDINVTLKIKCFKALWLNELIFLNDWIEDR